MVGKIIKDKFYLKACEEAKEDFFFFRAERTDKQVQENAEKMRNNNEVK